MKISLDIKRVLLTTATCIAFALTSEYLNLIKEIIFLTPLFFSIAILLTNLDKIITKKKYQAFILSAMLTTLLFFMSAMGLLIGQSLFGQYAIYIACLLSGLFALLINSLFIKIDNLKAGLLTVGLLSLTMPPLTEVIKELKIFDLPFLGDPATFFIVWQTVMGLGISLSIWTKWNVTQTA